MQNTTSRWRWLIALTVGIVLWVASAVGASLLASAFMGISPEGIRGLSLIPYALIRMPLVTISVLFPVRIAGAGWGLLQLFALIPLTGGSQRSDVIASLELTGGSWSGALGLIVTGWLVGGFAEELFFRGYLILAVKNLLGDGKWATVLAVLASILGFAYAHRYQGWVGVARCRHQRTVVHGALSLAQAADGVYHRAWVVRHVGRRGSVRAVSPGISSR